MTQKSRIASSRRNRTKTVAGYLPGEIQGELIALYGAGEWARLVIASDDVTKRYPHHPLGWQASGKALLHLGHSSRAIEKLSWAVRLAPGNADGYNDLGNALYDVGRLNDSIANYRRAVEIDPRSQQAWSNLGRCLCRVGQFEEAIECCRNAIRVNPASAIAHNNLGNALSEDGRAAEAEESYRTSLALLPGYLDAMINLSGALGDLGRWDEARSTCRLAVQNHPNSGIAHNALGRLLSRLGEDDQEAKQHLERAVALNAHDTNTFVELGNILMRAKQVDAALEMFRRAQGMQPLITWRANQENAEFSAVFLDTPMAGSTPVNYLAGRAPYDRHFHCVIPDTPADIDLLRRKADVVFNMICNADDGAHVLVQARDLADRLGRPIVNHPRLIMDTNRECMARRLNGIPYCVIPRTLRLAGRDLWRAALNGACAGFELPLLARVAGSHGGDDFSRFDEWKRIADFVSGDLDLNYYLIQFVDYRSDDRLFRKYRFIFIDGEVFPYHLAIHEDWKVHHFRTAMANHAWMRHEEERFLQNMSFVFDPARQTALQSIAQASGLDYGGIDCGLDRDGQVVVFEANASMLVHDEKAEPFIYKNPYIARIKRAFDAMLARRRMSA